AVRQQSRLLRPRYCNGLEPRQRPCHERPLNRPYSVPYNSSDFDRTRAKPSERWTREFSGFPRLYRARMIGAEREFAGRTFLSTYDIARVAAIQARVVRLVVFSSQRG